MKRITIYLTKDDDRVSHKKLLKVLGEMLYNEKNYKAYKTLKKAVLNKGI